MLLDAYVWCWINLHPIHMLRSAAKLLGLAALLLIPLLYLNVNLARNGFTPSPPRPELQISQPPEFQSAAFDRR
jgi:hypothetical protein